MGILSVHAVLILTALTTRRRGILQACLFFFACELPRRACKCKYCVDLGGIHVLTSQVECVRGFQLLP